MKIETIFGSFFLHFPLLLYCFMFKGKLQITKYVMFVCRIHFGQLRLYCYVFYACLDSRFLLPFYTVND